MDTCHLGMVVEELLLGTSTSSSNSVGVAISKPRVAGAASYPGCSISNVATLKELRLAVGVTRSRIMSRNG